jgi:hypothetical protein
MPLEVGNSTDLRARQCATPPVAQIKLEFSLRDPSEGSQQRRIAGFFAQRVDRTKLDPRAPPRLSLVESLFSKPSDKPFEVQSHLLVQLAVEAR